MQSIIIFDYDGVIIDSTELAREHSKWEWPEITREEHDALYNGNIFEQMTTLQSPRTAEEKSEYRSTIHLPNKKKLSAYEGIKEVIMYLAEKYTLVINTSSMEKDVSIYLETHGMLSCFSRIYGKETSKSKVEKFGMIMKNYNVIAEECIFITDTLGDLLEANTLHIPTLIVTYGYHKMNSFEGMQDKMIGVAKTPEEILEVINAIK